MSAPGSGAPMLPLLCGDVMRRVGGGEQHAFAEGLRAGVNYAVFGGRTNPQCRAVGWLLYGNMSASTER